MGEAKKESDYVTPANLEVRTVEWLGRLNDGYLRDKVSNTPSILNAVQVALEDYPQLITLLPRLMVEHKCNKGLAKEINTVIASVEVLQCLGSDE